jgi:hypothetical protein
LPIVEGGDRRVAHHRQRRLIDEDSRKLSSHIRRAERASTSVVDCDRQRVWSSLNAVLPWHVPKIVEVGVGEVCVEESLAVGRDRRISSHDEREELGWLSWKRGLRLERLNGRLRLPRGERKVAADVWQHRVASEALTIPDTILDPRSLWHEVRDTDFVEAA